MHADLSSVIRPHARVCYVAGPMANMPEHNFPRFKEAAQILRNEGWVVRCPTEGVPEETLRMAIDLGWAFRDTQEYRDLMRRDLCLVLEAERVFVLDGWERSNGARREVMLAQTVGTPIIRITDRSEVTEALEPVVPSEVEALANA